MNINYTPNSSASPTSSTPHQKRKRDVISSEMKSRTLSPSASPRRLRSAPKNHAAFLGKNKGKHISQQRSPSPRMRTRPLSFQSTGRTVRALESTSSQSSSSVSPIQTSSRSSYHNVFSSSPKAPLARHLRVLSRHIEHCQLTSGSTAGPNASPDAAKRANPTAVSLTRIPSIMDVYLDAKSPSIDFTEEVLLEIADRTKRLSQVSRAGCALVSSHYCDPPHHAYDAYSPYSPYNPCDEYNEYNGYNEYHGHRMPELSLGLGLGLGCLSSEVSGLSLSGEQIWSGRNAAHSGNSMRHPDSFVRSTAAWSEGLNGQC
ncbi:hypothetical protein BDP27DRAFT_1312989 [Rhodocollybia butyracea]|uniref:Uncharacterized protein n=1 Tax=Rhodocollybia butyracea TaxID=206335 RepID=A0A9P5UF88_9AGAR|nr:hypothetical protein BDP27DRAFT_1312989 [Rhodocollybia butyracea]